MTNNNALPLSIRDTPPYPNAIRLTGERPDGLPDGFHTGGAWEHDGWIYKPLDGRPFANAENHYPTDEDKVLEEMAGQPLFPKNWTVEIHNGRRFLVRQKAAVVGGKEVGWKDLSREQVLEIEQGIRNLNAHNWEVNDLISLGIDLHNNYQLFVLDMSAAQKMAGNACWKADDEIRIEQFFDMVGCNNLKALRHAARHEVVESTCDESHPAYTSFGEQKYKHVYASFNRPIDCIWADRLRSYDLRMKYQLCNYEKGIPLTWIMSHTPIDQETLDRYEFVWGWSPIPYIQGEK